MIYRSKKTLLELVVIANVEDRAITRGERQLIWIKRLLKDINIPGTSTMNLYTDMLEGIVRNPVQRNWKRHV